MSRIFTGYEAGFARPEQAEEVYAFYDTPNRTDAVYLRNKDIIEGQVRKGLFFTVRQNGRIVAASTVYPLADGQTIDCISDEGRVVERGSVAELGSVLKWGAEANERGEQPKDFFHPLLFAVPMAEAFRQAGKELTFNLLVANVQPQLTDNINRLMVGPPKSPHRWELIKAAAALQDAFRATTDDPNADKTKHYFRASVNNLPDISKYLLECAKNGYMSNRHGDKLMIDMRALPLDMYSAIVDNKRFFRHLPSNTSWTEARRIFEPSMPTEGNHRPLPPANGWGRPPAKTAKIGSLKAA